MPHGLPSNPIDSAASQLASMHLNGALRGGDASGLSIADLKHAKKVASGFESMLMHRLTQAMRGTIPDSGLLGDGISKQVDDLFWFHMAEGMAAQGGTGFGRKAYEDICRQMGATTGSDARGANDPGAGSAPSGDWLR